MSLHSRIVLGHRMSIWRNEIVASPTHYGNWPSQVYLENGL